jgi:hypothetical protein
MALAKGLRWRWRPIVAVPSLTPGSTADPRPTSPSLAPAPETPTFSLAADRPR